MTVDCWLTKIEVKFPRFDGHSEWLV